jgi:hypothetical protein
LDHTSTPPPHLLVGYRLGRVVHQLLDGLEAAHLAVDLLQRLGALLDAGQDIALDARKLDVGRQLQQLLELRIGRGDERFVELFAPQSEQGLGSFVAREELARRLRLALGRERRAFLVLLEPIALHLEFEDRPGSGTSAGDDGWPGACMA